MSHKNSINGKKIKELNNSWSDFGTRESRCLRNEVEKSGQDFLWGGDFRQNRWNQGV